MSFGVGYAGKNGMVFPEKRKTRKVSAPAEYDQKECQRATNTAKGGSGRPADARFEHRLRKAQQRVGNRSAKDDECYSQQPGANEIVERQREEIESERLAKDRIGDVCGRLIPVERKLSPVLL